MRSMLVSEALLVIATLFGCASSPQSYNNGPIIGVLQDVTIEDARSRIIQRCALNGAQVEEANPNFIVCAKVMTGGKAAATQLLLGNGYSTPPQAKLRVTFFAFEGGVQISLNEWVETQMALGQVKRQEYANAGELRSFLDGIGAR